MSKLRRRSAACLSFGSPGRHQVGCAHQEACAAPEVAEGRPAASPPLTVPLL